MTWTTRQRSNLAGLTAIVEGAGQDILLIHGVGLQADAWNKQIDALALHFRVIAVDMPGHGKNSMPSERLDLAGYTDAIAKVLEGPVMVVGHSMGAMIALDMASRYPDRVRGVAALNAIYQRSPEASRAVKARAASLDGSTVADVSPTLDRWFGRAPSPERDACEVWLTTVNQADYKMAYEVFAQEDGPNLQTLAKLGVPALFMTGRDEPNSTPDMSQSMAVAAPQGRVHIVEHAAHMMPMTHADEVNTHLLDFAGEVYA